MLLWSRVLGLSVTGVLAVCQRAVGATVDSTILILARDAYSASSASLGFEGYGIPYETVIVPKEGVTLPSLTAAEDQGRYGGIVVMGAVSYDYGGAWRSALTDAQWTSIHQYQTNFSVRMTRIDEFPGPAYGECLLHTPAS